AGSGMDVFEAMRRRRMHRYFDGAPLDQQTLQVLAWAATRAPAGGNQPSRHILVVRDPAVVKTLVEVTPSYIGTLPPAVLVVLTDIVRAEAQMGTQGRDHLSRLDAGAAAEHIALAAVSLGLGCYLFRCSNEAALRVVLDLPPSVRVDWLAAVGRPAATPSVAPKAPKQTVQVDRWGGEQWGVHQP
ncbi:MAG: nitroreductase family protein, partial [Acidimicrobiales bacterium]